MSCSDSEFKYAFEKPGNYARGWHIVCFSQELKSGDIKPLNYFQQALVLFRGSNGQAAILDAYCPHLGASLAGVGTRVEGNNIRCAFHGWEFNSSGACAHIPYASKIPERAKSALKSWPICEKNGFIAIWYDSENGEPNWQLPDIPDWGPAGWGHDWRFNRKIIKGHGREVIENIVDIGHFASVHGGYAKQFDNVFTAFSVMQESSISQHPDASFIQPDFLDFDLGERRQEAFDKESDEWGQATYHGPSVMYYYATHRAADISYKTWWLNYHTAINDEEIELTSGVIVTTMDDRPLPDEFFEFYPISAIAAFGQDVEIWKTKRYLADPILCDGDGPVNKLRKWYNRFYLPRDQEGWDEPATVISSLRECNKEPE